MEQQKASRHNATTSESESWRAMLKAERNGVHETLGEREGERRGERGRGERGRGERGRGERRRGERDGGERDGGGREMEGGEREEKIMLLLGSSSTSPITPLPVHHPLPPPSHSSLLHTLNIPLTCSACVALVKLEGLLLIPSISASAVCAI